jgi:hypothetical protein
MEKTWSRLQRQAEDALSRAQDQANEALQYARDLWDQTRDTATDAASRASHISTSDLRKRASSALDDAADTARPYLHRLGERLEELRGEALPYLTHLRHEATPYLRDLRKRVERFGHAASERLGEWRGSAADRLSDIRPMLGRGSSHSSGFAFGPLVGLIGGGAGLMYLMDSEKGADRRTQLCEKSADWIRRAENSIDALGTQVGHHIQAAMGHAEDDAEDMVEQLQPGEIKPWSKTTRVMAGAGGVGLLLAGAKRGGLGGLVMTAVGAGLVARASLDRPMDELLNLASDKAREMADKAEHGWDELKKSTRSFEPANHVQSQRS